MRMCFVLGFVSLSLSGTPGGLLLKLCFLSCGNKLSLITSSHAQHNSITRHGWIDPLFWVRNDVRTYQPIASTVLRRPIPYKLIYTRKRIYHPHDLPHHSHLHAPRKTPKQASSKKPTPRNSSRHSQVSWLRRRGADELNLITFGHHTYIGDSRYALEYQAPNDWQLIIQYANARDAGHYECQVSMHPPLVLLVYLTVIGECVRMFSSGGPGVGLVYCV